MMTVMMTVTMTVMMTVIITLMITVMMTVKMTVMSTVMSTVMITVVITVMFAELNDYYKNTIRNIIRNSSFSKHPYRNLAFLIPFRVDEAHIETRIPDRGAYRYMRHLSIDTPFEDSGGHVRFVETIWGQKR